MGFKREKLLKLHFTDGPYSGLEVQMRRLSIGELVGLGSLGGDEVSADTPESAAATEQQLERLLESLHSWNVEDDDGSPVEPTRENVLGDGLMALAILHKWMDSVDIPAPLERPSSNGARFPVELPPMDPLSPSQLSSFTPG